MELAKSIDTGQVNRSAADIYEEFFVPALFQRWASPVAEAAKVEKDQHVLDVACGTGVLARELATRVGPAGKVFGLDKNQGMLDVARRRAPSLHWRQGEAERLPFADNSFDAVLSQFGLMFFEDRRQSIREMVRVLRPGQRLTVAVWDSLENTPGYAAASMLLDRLFGATIAESLRGPYVLGDVATLGNLFDGSGLSDLSIDTLDGVASFASIEAWMHTDVRGWTLAGVLDDNQFDRLLEEAQISLQEFVLSDGRVEFSSPAHIVSAVKT